MRDESSTATAVAISSQPLLIPVDETTGELLPDFPGAITATGWDIPEGTPPDTVLPWLNKFMRWGQGIQWVIADGIRYTERTFGDTYTAAIETTGYEYDTLRNMVWVADNVDLSLRNDNLSFTHHAAVAPLPPDQQVEWLDRAEVQSMSVRDLRSAIAAEKHLTSPVARVADDGTAIVHHADALDFLQSIDAGTVDLLLTDPPYSTDVADIGGFVAAWIPLALSRLKPSGRAYICAGAYPVEVAAYLAAFADQSSLTCANLMVWTYRNTMGPAPSHDYKLNWQAIFHLRGPAAPPLNSPSLNELFSVIDITAPDGRHGTRVHAWQKPDALADRLIAHSTRPGDIVIDPFTGTGTFLAAAARAGCTAFGSETDPEMLAYCTSRGIEVVR